MASHRNWANGLLIEQWTNATQAGDPTPAGYTSFNPDGSVASTRALTANESSLLAGADTTNTAAANQSTIQAKAQTALTNNQTYLGIATPTNAQVVAQVASLTRQVNALIRLALQQFDATTGT